MGSMTLTYCNQGQWDEAVALQKAVVESCKTVLGDGHPDALEVMNNLAWSCENQEEWNMTVIIYDMVAKARKAELGERDPLTLTAVANLAFAYWKEGRLVVVRYGAADATGASRRLRRHSQVAVPE